MERVLRVLARFYPIIRNTNMKLQTIQGIDFSEKNVLVRVDFNVTLDEKGDIREKFKMSACKETIDYLLKYNGVRIALMTHLGRPEGRPNPAFSLRRITDDIERVLGFKVVFVESCVGDSVKAALHASTSGTILLLENVRFHPGEESNESGFANELADPFDCFVNDAFSVCHRDQASVTGVARFLPSYAGFWLQREVEHLSMVRKNPQHPAVAVIGGAKIQTKLPLIREFEGIYDSILVGGKIANEAIDEEMTFGPNVLLPIDFIDDRLDIGPKTVELFKTKLAGARTVVWNGPMGKFEDARYASGTIDLVHAMFAIPDAFTLVGGGESVEVLEENALEGKASFISTGGGAMLEFLGGEPMPGIDALMSEERSAHVSA